MHPLATGRFQQTVFVMAAIAFVVHLLDTLASGTQPLTLELDGAIASGALALAAAVAYARISPTMRAGLAVTLGAGWLYGCLHYHVIPTLERGPMATDLTGIAAALAGAALLATGVWSLLRVVARPRAGGTAAPDA